MAGESRNEVSPPPTFRFRATLFQGLVVPFQEMSAPDGGAQVIDDRHGGRAVVQPRSGSVGSVTLRKGVFENDDRFRGWFGGIRMNTLPRGTVTIVLLDEAGATRMTWTLERARPTRITGADLAAGGNEVAVESLEIAYETLVITA
ncbi:MAG TPA: phage tail protein [Longimicrobium sp.]|nr:phage tail protein [Longimicrobium sp.]